LDSSSLEKVLRFEKEQARTMFMTVLEPMGPMIELMVSVEVALSASESFAGYYNWDWPAFAILFGPLTNQSFKRS
jgi:hypothetical protein